MMTETHADTKAKTPARGRQSVPIEQRAEDALILMEDLADLLDDETDAVARHDFDRFTELQADKVDLATEYQSLVKQTGEKFEHPTNSILHIRSYRIMFYRKELGCILHNL